MHRLPEIPVGKLGIYYSLRIYIVGFISGVLVCQLLNEKSVLNALSGTSVTSTVDVQTITTKKAVAEAEAEAETMSTSSSAFDTMVHTAYEHMLHELPTSTMKQPFDVNTWTQRTDGGLNDADRTLLAKIYGNATSLLEYGLGESTYIANHVGVRRYAGIDSDPVWVGMARDKVSDTYRFYLADIGPTIEWGYPKKTLGKQIIDYELSPLILERDPFDVYMVDGRFRFACVLASFLHASSRGAPTRSTTVLLHDCKPSEREQETHRKSYHAGGDLLDLVEHSGNKLCVFKRKPNTTDAQLLDRWMKYKLQLARR